MFEKNNMNEDNEDESGVLENIDCSDAFNIYQVLIWFCILLK